MKRILLCLAIILTACASALAQLPSWVPEAIQLGMTKDVTAAPVQRKTAKAEVPFGTFTTPYLRVAIAAAQAHKKNLPFTAKMVTPEMVADNLIVLILPVMHAADAKAGTTALYQSVDRLAIKKPKSIDLKDTIQPASMELFTRTLTDAQGGKIAKQGVVATFPMDAFKEGNYFYLIYEKTPPGSGVEIPMTKEMIQAGSPKG